MPESSVTSTSTVGFPRESRICRPRTLVMVLTRHSSASLYGPLRRIAQGLPTSAGGTVVRVRTPRSRPRSDRVGGPIRFGRVAHPDVYGRRLDAQQQTVDLRHLDPL